jgi:CubicO group peptidase (beta-lactamase class C family)
MHRMAAASARALRFVMVCAGALGALSAAADTPTGKAPQASEFGRADQLLFWTPAQQQIGYRNMDKIGPSRTLSRGQGQAFALPYAPKDLSGVKFQVAGQTYSTAQYLERNRVSGLLVIQNGKIVYEHYALGHTPDSKWTSFSVAKSLTSTLVGAAIKDGYIRSVDDRVTDYLPILEGSAYDGVTIRQVLQMSSGAAWNEDYTDPKSDVARIGEVTRRSGGLGLLQYMGALPRAAEPGVKFNYNTGETHLVGAIVRAAVGNNLATYASDKVWSKFAMEADGYWATTDAFGAEHAGCCVSATLRDYGRIGMLALRKGVMPDGRSLVPDGWFKEATAASPANPGYGYQWWLYAEGNYAARGIFGQSIEIYEPQNLIIVTHSLWPVATSKEYSEYRRAFSDAVRDALT